MMANIPNWGSSTRYCPACEQQRVVPDSPAACGDSIKAAAEAVRNAVHGIVGPSFHLRLADLDLASVISGALQAAQPEGWQLVPVEPTQEMFAAARTSASGSSTEKLMMISYWRNMLAAAPPAPQQATEDCAPCPDCEGAGLVKHYLGGMCVCRTCTSKAEETTRQTWRQTAKAQQAEAPTFDAAQEQAWANTRLGLRDGGLTVPMSPKFMEGFRAGWDAKCSAAPQPDAAEVRKAALNAERYRYLTEEIGLRFSPKGSLALRDLDDTNAAIDAAIEALKKGGAA